MRYRTLENEHIKSFIAKHYSTSIAVTEDADKHLLVNVSGIDSALHVVKKRTNYYVQHGQHSLLVRDYKELKSVIDSVLMSVAGVSKRVAAAAKSITISGDNLTVVQA